MATAQRFAAGLEYDGSAFFGWQHQGEVRSVQEAVNRALSAVANSSITTAAAGRTDAGVHALGQVIHFDSDAPRSTRSWLLGANSHLPADAALQWVCPVPVGFHARYCAVGRTYRYVILNRPIRSALERDRAWCLREPLDADLMAAAGNALEGERDFSAFRGAGCQADSPVRRVDRLRVQRRADTVLLEVRATGFLYHMVRNIVGSLVQVGAGLRPEGWLAELLATRDRRLAAPTAPAGGLYLADVHYPTAFALPSAPPDAYWRDP